MCFRRNKNLKDFLWMKTIANNKVQKVILSNRKGYSIICHSKTRNLCRNQIKHTNRISSTVTKRTYNIYSKLNCKSSYLIYLKPLNGQCSHHIETSQLIYSANHLTGFYMMGTLAVKGLTECTLCKRQYTGTSEIAFNIILNNHRKDIYKTTRQKQTKILDYLVIISIDTQNFP